MNKTVRKKSTTIYVFHFPALLVIAVMFVAILNYAKVMDARQGSDSNVLGKGSSKNENKGASNKNESNQGKPEDAGNTDKGNKSSENTTLHKQKVQEVVNNLTEISDEEEQMGNQETSEDIDEVATEEEEKMDEVGDAIGAVETRPKWKTLLLGSDYKNLGQLRSYLAHNTNSIRKLSQAQGEVLANGNEAEVQAQLGQLLQERERIRGVIMAHESEFGVLGWVFRFLSGYVGGSLDDGLEDYIDVPESTESSGSSTI